MQVTARLSEKRSVQGKHTRMRTSKKKKLSIVWAQSFCYSCARFAARAERDKLALADVHSCGGKLRFCSGNVRSLCGFLVSSRKAAALFKTLTTLRKVCSKGASIPLRSLQLVPATPIQPLCKPSARAKRLAAGLLTTPEKWSTQNHVKKRVRRRRQLFVVGIIPY